MKDILSKKKKLLKKTFYKWTKKGENKFSGSKEYF
jgi:hypothetical protein